MSSQTERDVWEKGGIFAKIVNRGLPGPGYYQRDRSLMNIHSILKSILIKYIDKNKASLSSFIKQPIKKIRKSKTNKGSIAYINSNKTVEKKSYNLMKLKMFVEGKKKASGPFCSKEERFSNIYYKDEESKPGPGEYLNKNEINDPINCKKSSMFSSKTDRFDDMLGGNQFIHVVGNKNTQTLPNEFYEINELPPQSVNLPGVGFNSNVPRWKDDDSKAPGPGEYLGPSDLIKTQRNWNKPKVIERENSRTHQQQTATHDTAIVIHHARGPGGQPVEHGVGG